MTLESLTIQETFVTLMTCAKKTEVFNKFCLLPFADKHLLSLIIVFEFKTQQYIVGCKYES